MLAVFGRLVAELIAAPKAADTESTDALRDSDGFFEMLDVDEGVGFPPPEHAATYGARVPIMRV